ncbi:hypothetical protein BJY04DRAFT_60595 [Aspergillus karnatakaensis]|uniref:uncharacterized protein n=1 Tax=Aspergillus karnatakaensis TaxID=1810916 RepID=UPI003CCD3886
MSSRSTDYTRKPTISSRGRLTHSERDLIDHRLNRLREEVLPFYPFLLTVPTDVPFRLGNRFVNNWAVSDDGPFAPEEQQLQYMTFLTHDDSDSLLVAVGDWSDTTASVMADSRSRPQSATSTPSSGHVKKKISLHDYKNKRNNGTSPSPRSQGAAGHQDASTLHVPNDNHTSTHITTSDNYQKPPKKIRPQNHFAQSNPEHVDRKRSAERDRYINQIKDGISAKRRRISPEPTTTHSEAEPINGGGLPELLSPTLPPTSSTPRLPRLLSPTLPPELEKELAKLSSETLAPDLQLESIVSSDTAKSKIEKDKLSKRGISHLGSTHVVGTLNPLGKSPLVGPEKTASRGVETMKTTSQTTSKINVQAPTSNKPLQSHIAKPAQPSLSRPRLPVKLKYGRSNRKRVEALLKFSGKRKHSYQDSPSPDALEEKPTKAEHQKAFTSDKTTNKTTRVDGKSKFVVSSQASSSTKDPSKESRIHRTDKPQTPVLSQAQQERTRPVSLTPAKDLKHPSSRHDLASNEGRGHHHAVARKAPADSAAGVSTQSPSQPSSADRNGDRRAWKEEYQKYGNLGRELKHAADRHTAKDKVTSTDEKLAAATAIEAIICFVLAFIAEDQSKAISRQIGDSSTWLSIIAYWRVVRKNSLPFPPLNSLCCILGAVSYDAIHALDLERLAVTPIPGEHTPVPTPASDGHSAHSDESKKSLKEFLELKTRLPECYKESQRLWFDGSRGLSEEFLAREFPETWSRRARNYTEQGKKRLKPGEYSGEIYLPLGKTSTPLEVLRFSCAMLREWCSNEKIDWRGKLDI